MTVFCRGFSFDLVTRVFDVFIYEGEKILYRVSLALLEVFASQFKCSSVTPSQNIRESLLAASFEEIMGILRDIPSTVDAHHVMELAFTIPVSAKYIHKYSKKFEHVYEQQMKEKAMYRERNGSPTKTSSKEETLTS